MFPCRDQVVVVYDLLLMGLRVCVPVESHTDSAVQLCRLFACMDHIHSRPSSSANNTIAKQCNH